MLNGGVEIRKSHLPDQLVSELGQLTEARQRIEGIAADNQVVLGALASCSLLADGPSLVEESDLGDPVVGRRHPLVGAVFLGQQPQVLVGPGELEGSAVAG